MAQDELAAVLGFEDMDVEIMPEDESMDWLEDVKNADELDLTDFNINIAEHLKDDEAFNIVQYCTQRFEDDLESRKEFDSVIKRGIETLGLKIEDLNDPFPGASSVRHPIVLEAALKTQAKIMNEVFTGQGVAKTWLASKSSDVAIARANRVEKYLNYQLLHDMREYIPDTGKIAFRYALTGNCFRKFFYDPIRRKVRSRIVTEDRMIVNNAVTLLSDADFFTEKVPLSKYDFEMLVTSGEYIDPRNEPFGSFYQPDFDSVANGANPTDTEQVIFDATGDTLGVVNEKPSQDRFSVLEHYCYLKLPEPFNDGQDIPLPYIVTILEGEGKLLSIRRNWKQGDDTYQQRVWHSHYKLFEGMGFYGLGYIHTYGNFQVAMTQILRSVLDAGQFANLQGGFKSAEARWVGDGTMVAKPGFFKDLRTNGLPINQVIQPFNFKEPSAVLTSMAQWMDGRIMQFADSAEQMTGNSVTNAAVGSTLALLETATKLTNGILKRFYHSVDQELKILHEINADTITSQKTFYMKSEEFTVFTEDFAADVVVIPAADPNLATNSQRMALANAELQAALQDGRGIVDRSHAYRKFFLAIGTDPDDVERLVPPKQQAPQPQQLDPMSDIMAVSQGQPIKAFPGQNHRAHIEFKTSFLNDPMGGKNPVNQNIVPLIQANIQEHLLLEYQARLAASMQSVNSPDVELSMALAAQKLQELNTVQMNSEALAKGDAETMLGMAEIKNAETREKEVEYRKQAQDQKTAVDLFKSMNSSNRDTQRSEDAFSIAQLQAGAKMITESMKGAKKPE